MSIASAVLAIIDYGGRRSGIERRQFSYTEHIPARRSNKDRRSGLDRRSKPDRRNGLDRRTIEGSMKIIKVDARKNKDRRCFIERRTSFATVPAAIS